MKVYFRIFAVVLSLLALCLFTSASASSLSDAFGSSGLDMDSLQAYVDELEAGFRADHPDIYEFGPAVDDAVAAYALASVSFSGTLRTAVLTGSSLSDDSRISLRNDGLEMYSQLYTAIACSAAESMTYLQRLFGGEGVAELDESYQTLIDLSYQGYENAVFQATELKGQLDDALTDAFADNIVALDEYTGIMDILKTFNQAVSDAAV